MERVHYQSVYNKTKRLLRKLGGGKDLPQLDSKTITELRNKKKARKKHLKAVEENSRQLRHADRLLDTNQRLLDQGIAREQERLARAERHAELLKKHEEFKVMKARGMLKEAVGGPKPESVSPTEEPATQPEV